MAAQQLRTILNGPVVAGVGATVDAGLAVARYHALLWDPKARVVCDIWEDASGFHIKPKSERTKFTGQLDDVLKCAMYNVDQILGIKAILAKAANASEQLRTDLELDAIAIVFLMMVYNYYDNECRIATAKERQDMTAIVVSEALHNSIVNPTRLNRAATFLLARMHTKYQTNHAIGGTPMQASMASTVRAFYGISPSSAKSASATESMKAIADIIYWAVHPANETLLLPTVIANTGITKTLIHANGPEVAFVAIEEYFHIRARTPPASTHHFYVAAAAAKQLEPMGILKYLPEPTRMKDVLSGLRMIETYGARLHPAARYWGLERMTANQKVVETVCADLGYAVRKLMSATSLAASPILKKEDGLDSGWMKLIDAIKAAMDERGKELISKEVFEQITKAIAPKEGVVDEISDIKGFLTQGPVNVIREDSDEQDVQPGEYPFVAAIADDANSGDTGGDAGAPGDGNPGVSTAGSADNSGTAT